MKKIRCAIYTRKSAEEGVPSIYSSARTELAKLLIYGLFRKIRVLAQDEVVICMVTTRPPKTLVKPTALGPVANTDTNLLIYGLFQKGRVLAQDGLPNQGNARPRAVQPAPRSPASSSTKPATG